MRVDGRRRRIHDAARSKEEQKQANEKGLSSNTKEGVDMIFEDVDGIDKDEAGSYCASKVPEDLQANPSSSLYRRRSVKGAYPLMTKSSFPSVIASSVVSSNHFIKQYQELSICALELRFQSFPFQ